MSLLLIILILLIIMRILSWDVGIIHLAYCLIEIEEGGVKIKDWDNINLLQEEEIKCHGFINSNNENSVCIKKPDYEYINGNEKYNFCLLHKRQFQKIEKNIISIKKCKKGCFCEIKKSNKEICNKKAKFEINDINKKINACQFHYNHYIKKNNVLKKRKKINASKMPIGKIKRSLIDKLDKKKFNNIDYVLIENQPSMKNPKMKSVAETLYSWFLIRGLTDKNINNLKNIFYLSPSNKLKINDENLNKEIAKLKNSSKKYKFTKDSAILHTRKILKDNNNDWTNFLNDNKKKDDLCDAFLQGVYFVNNKKKFI